MQLQARLADLEAAGAYVVALSYDEPDALRDFAEAHEIAFRLLSDPDSEVIKQFGILNTLIAQDDHPWYGIPFPGTYVIDADGVVTHKFFDSNLAVRAGPEQLLRALAGESSNAHLLDDSVAEAPAEGVEVTVFLDGDNLTLTVQRDLVARVRVPPGRHLYADPSPTGSVAVLLELDDQPAVVQRPLVRPAGEAHSLQGSDEVFTVHHGMVELRLPVTINGALKPEEAWREVTLTGTLRWQTCDDLVCDVPASRRFELTVPLVPPPALDIGAKPGIDVREPNATRHFQNMTARRSPKG